MPDLFKIEVFLPEEALEKVMDALSEAGAGEIGEYERCFAYTPVIGTFRPKANAKPYIGSVGIIEKVHEYKLEVNCRKESVTRAVYAVRKVHPYEEPVINVLSVHNGVFEGTV